MWFCFAVLLCGGVGVLCVQFVLLRVVELVRVVLLLCCCACLCCFIVVCAVVMLGC